MRDERTSLLIAIARKTLGIKHFKTTGQPDADLHLVSAEALGRALEAAYDAGLLVGHRATRSEHGECR